ncbi:MAG: hypothetical protein UR54_C0025G0021 [Candidatus Roizmanbacteria bacterium GW2011_GWA2_34_18]|uniref:Uncharacterized protein n=1 Tax=Candidatus Roizmanbacteria bacterium GW2011_GWA2_34_18 TaxID=1618477 RepID=A0A0G0AS52_9BACT|nr:MAG: hypothetical protein UR54_C0025G0021 [Candidatus Roizmanbacteria bacterium GW2011_GWA2_34_18]
MLTKNYTAIDDLLDKTKNRDKISLSKEAEPIAAGKFEIKEIAEDNLEEEVRPFVSPRAETIELPPNLKKLGLQAVSNSNFPSYKNIKLPLSDEKIIVGQKAPITSSLRWLATLALYILGQAHLGLKVIHGHVIRVLKR